MIHLQLCMLCVIHLTLTQSLHSHPLSLSFSDAFIILPALQESSWVCSQLRLLSDRPRIWNAALHLSGFQLNHKKTGQSYHNHLMTHIRLEDNKDSFGKIQRLSGILCYLGISNKCDFIIRPMRIFSSWAATSLQQVTPDQTQITIWWNIKSILYYNEPEGNKVWIFFIDCVALFLIKNNELWQLCNYS